MITEAIPKTKRIDYSRRWIVILLENYHQLEQGVKLEPEDREPGERPSCRATFEDSVIAKADIDRAIDSLSTIQKRVITDHYIKGYTLQDLTEKFPDIERIIKSGIWDMYHFLNGECVLRRWARENGFVNSARNVDFPDDLPKEIVQYIKDICIDYCVLSECPE